ncbi:BRCA1-A complex subunit Abraxas 1 isoform X1 [Syngnathoides biaculeatus]|uniref:BRCA1-A complex subunit Abraxas 1 isoform X1 n=1 Tax=Syngnathoides biaculeatus TaxID=300417 RepID=UPI002ADDD106|nr:BRCA1-A complex subunit Abraxas 1 isoform X1 [Syngnathoides biaculeatus]
MRMSAALAAFCVCRCEARKRTDDGGANNSRVWNCFDFFIVSTHQQRFGRGRFHPGRQQRRGARDHQRHPRGPRSPQTDLQHPQTRVLPQTQHLVRRGGQGGRGGGPPAPGRRPSGARDRLVPPAQELGAADDHAREGGAPEPEGGAAQAPRRLPARDARHRDGRRLHPPHRIRRLPLQRQVPVAVTNLASLDHRAYWTASTPCSAPGYQRAVSRHSSKLLDASGQLADVDAVNAMNASLQDELQRACSAVAESERTVRMTLADVFALGTSVGDRKSTFANKAEGAPAGEPKVRLQLAVRTLTLDGFPAAAAAAAQGGGVRRRRRRKRRKGDATNVEKRSLSNEASRHHLRNQPGSGFRFFFFL